MSKRKRILLFGGLAIVLLGVIALIIITTSTTPTPSSLCQCGTIYISKFKDLDCDGIQDNNEPPLYGWTFTITDASGNVVTTITTTASPVTQCVEVSPGTYTITEVAQSGWGPTSPAGGTTTVTVPANSGVPVLFGNMNTTCVTIQVLRLSDSSPMSNMTVEAQSSQDVVYGTTDANGLVCLLVLINTSYEVKAYGTFGVSDFGTPQPINVMTPSWSADLNDCGTPKCPLVGTVYADLIVGIPD